MWLGEPEPRYGLALYLKIHTEYVYLVRVSVSKDRKEMYLKKWLSEPDSKQKIGLDLG